MEKAEPVARVLHENESARVESVTDGRTGIARVTVLAPSSQSADFVREIPKRTIKTLDLVDVVAGGDGFSGRRGRGIDPTNGRYDRYAAQTATRFLYPDRRREVSSRRGPAVCRWRLHSRRPRRPVQSRFRRSHLRPVSRYRSSGHAGYIWAGGVEFRTHSLVLRPSCGGHRLCFARSWPAVPARQQGNHLRSGGNSAGEPRLEAGAIPRHGGQYTPRRLPVADLWVFVDGQVRFRRREISSAQRRIFDCVSD